MLFFKKSYSCIYLIALIKLIERSFLVSSFKGVRSMLLMFLPHLEFHKDVFQSRFIFPCVIGA